MIDYLSLLSKYTAGEDPRTVPAFLIHSALVTRKALAIAERYQERTGEVVDLRLLEEFGMLHDIGIFRTETPALFTHGQGPYRAHMIYGHDILVGEGHDRHAKAAKNHTAMRAHEVRAEELPVPEEDHLPDTVEEEILFLADQFYSKDFRALFAERSVAEIRGFLERKPDKLALFEELWAKYWGLAPA